MALSEDIGTVLSYPRRVCSPGHDDIQLSKAVMPGIK